MNTSELKSIVSIEFGLNKLDAGNIVDNIFESITECLRSNKKFEIQKFGKFKVTGNKDIEGIQYEVKFTPASKLAKRINYNFDKLKEIELQVNKYPMKESVLTSAEMEEKFLKVGIISGEAEIHNPIVQRKLISDDVVKLHKEITEEKNSTDKKNIWG